MNFEEIYSTLTLLEQNQNDQKLFEKVEEIFKLPLNPTQNQLNEFLTFSIQILKTRDNKFVHQIVFLNLKKLITQKHYLLKDLWDLYESLLDYSPGDLSRTVTNVINTQNNVNTLVKNEKIIKNLFNQIMAMLVLLGFLENEKFKLQVETKVKLIKEITTLSPSIVYSNPNSVYSNVNDPNFVYVQMNKMSLNSNNLLQCTDLVFQLYSIVQEMNPETSSLKTFTKHRKVAVAFRDSYLKEILEIGLTLYSFGIGDGNTVDLINSCLGFDFLGTLSDQDSHGLTSAIQFPSSFKSLLLDMNPIKILVQGIGGNVDGRVIEALGSVMGCRRSLFADEERIVNSLVLILRCCEGVMSLLRLNHNESSRLELLKLLYKFSSIYSTDFRKSAEISQTLLQDLLNFTQSIISSTSPTEFLFILQTWVQLRDSEHSFFQTNLEQLYSLLITFLDLNDQVLSEFYYDDENTVDQVTSPLGKLFRLFPSNFARETFSSRLHNPTSIIHLAWIIEIYSNYISNRIAYQAEKEDDANDGLICSLIFGLFKQPPQIHIYERALLTFLEQFKHTFLTGDGSSCPSVWEVLAENGVQSQDICMEIYMTKIFGVLVGNDEVLAMKSIVVFKELVNGVRTSKLLQRREVLEGIVGSGVIGMDIVMGYQASKCLTVLFENLGRVFMSETVEQEEGMKKLLGSVEEYLEGYRSGKNDGTKVDLCVRKLRGVLAAIYSCKLFKIFFHWIDQYMDVIGYYLETGAPNGPVNVLKFVRDLVTNKVNRMMFESNAEYGILVFRRAMRIVLPVVIKLEGALSGDIPENIFVGQCLKPITVIMDTFKNIIASRAVPFGILELYGDNGLKEMVQSAFLLSSFIRPDQILQFPKLGSAYFNLWVCMAGDYISYLCKGIDDQSFINLSMNIYTVLENLDNSTSSQACTLISAIYTEANPTGRFFGIELGNYHRCLIPLILSRLLGVDIETQWSFTRPLFPLVMLDLDWFQAYLSHLTSQQSGNQESIQKILFAIMNGIEDNKITSRNRDRFTANVESVKRNLRTDGFSIEFGNLQYFK